MILIPSEFSYFTDMISLPPLAMHGELCAHPLPGSAEEWDRIGEFPRRPGSRHESGFVGLVEHRLERLGGLLQLGCRIGAADHVGKCHADRVAELGHRHDFR